MFGLINPDTPPLLAMPDDVKHALGRELTTEEAAKVNSILRKASELFRDESGQLFTAGASHVQLKVNGGQVYLPQRPVTEVVAVTNPAGSALTWDLFDQWLTVACGSHAMVRVQYEHGGAIPPLVTETVAEIAKKVLLISPDASRGVSQMSANGYSETYATWATGGQTALSPEDRAIARRFRVRLGNVWVQRP